VPERKPPLRRLPLGGEQNCRFYFLLELAGKSQANNRSAL